MQKQLDQRLFNFQSKEQEFVQKRSEQKNKLKEELAHRDKLGKMMEKQY